MVEKIFRVERFIEVEVFFFQLMSCIITLKNSGSTCHLMKLNSWKP